MLDKLTFAPVAASFSWACFHIAFCTLGEVSIPATAVVTSLGVMWAGIFVGIVTDHFNQKPPMAYCI